MAYLVAWRYLSGGLAIYVWGAISENEMLESNDAALSAHLCRTSLIRSRSR
jgi:hypothetical protein